MLKFVLVLSLLIPPQMLIAQETTPRGDKVIYDVDVLPNYTVREVIDKSHSLIEGEESGKFFEDWKEAVNFKKKVIDAYRWVSATKQGAVSGVVFDSVLLFGLSHGLETSSGPILVSAGISNGWPEWITAALGLGGAVISVPGLDPLCIVIFGIYSKSAMFRSVIGKFRTAIVRTADGAATVTGLKAFLNNIFIRPDYKAWMSEMDNLDRIRKFNDGRTLAEYSYPTLENPILKVEIEAGQTGRAYLKRVLIDKNKAGELHNLRLPWLKQFGWNARDFVEKFVLRNMLSGQIPDKAYVASIGEKKEWSIVTLLPNAIGSGPRIEVSMPRAMTCPNIFSVR